MNEQEKNDLLALVSSAKAALFKVEEALKGTGPNLAQLIDASGWLWVFDSEVGRNGCWKCVSDLREPDSLSQSFEEVMSEKEYASIYQGFDSVHAVIGDHGVTA